MNKLTEITVTQALCIGGAMIICSMIFSFNVNSPDTPAVPKSEQERYTESYSFCIEQVRYSDTRVRAPEIDACSDAAIIYSKIGK